MTGIEPHRAEEDWGTSNWRSNLFVLFIFTPFLILAVLYLKISLQSIFVRNDIGYPEGASVYAFLTALRTHKLYISPFDFPWNPEMYGPIFYLVGSVLAIAARGDAMLTTELARSLSFLSYVGSVGLIGFLSWRLERQKCWTAITIVLGLACSWAAPFASARPDNLSIFLILCALVVYDVAEGRSRLVFWVGVLGMLSCLTKQSTAPILVALALDSLIARRFQNLAALIAGSIPVPALVFSTLWFRHEPFLLNLFAVGHAVFNWREIGPLVIHIMHWNQIAMIPICIGLLGAGLSWKKEKYRTILQVTAFTWHANLASFANTGGYSNYLILPWLMTILLVPAGFVWIEKRTGRSALFPLALTLLSVFLLIYQRDHLIMVLPANLDTNNVDKLKMLSDLSYLELRSRQPQLLDPLYYNHLSLRNEWSIAPILQRIDSEEYDLVLINGFDGRADSEFSVIGFRGISHWGAGTLSEIGRHYRVLCEVHGDLAFVPQDKFSTLQPEDVGRIFRQPCRASNRTLQLAPGTR